MHSTMQRCGPVLLDHETVSCNRDFEVEPVFDERESNLWYVYAVYRNGVCRK